MNKYDIKQDLLFARKAEGFKLYRLDSRIDDLLEGLNLPLESNFSLLKCKFIDTLNEIDDPETKEVLFMNFAISKEYENVAPLQSRRELFLRDKKMNLDKLLLIEDAGLNEFLRLLNTY